MSDICQYFTVGKKRPVSDLTLPNPHGPLSKQVPTQSIRQANREVQISLEKSGTEQRGPYQNFSLEQKQEIAKYAVLHGTAAAIRQHQSKMPEVTLKESTVRTWRDRYRSELKKQQPEQPVMLQEKKKGRPLLIGEDLESQVQAYTRRLRDSGCVVTSAVVISAAQGIIKKQDSSMLDTNGGPVSLKKGWANRLLTRMGMVKRKVSTGKSTITTEKFEEVKAQMLVDIKCTVFMEDIPPELFVNWDQTAIHYVPQGHWTMAKSGSTRVEVAGLGDKRQITAVFGCTLAGDFLPLQLVYQGKTHACHPNVDFPKDWSITHTANHWSNESTMVEYIQDVWHHT